MGLPSPLDIVVASEMGPVHISFRVSGNRICDKVAFDSLNNKDRRVGP